MSKSDFLKSATPIQATVAGVPVIGTPKQFSSGSVGYNFNGKVQLPDGNRLQVSGNAVVIGSKDWPN